MSGSVRIAAKAWGDLRFKTLARLCNFADEKHALIMCAQIWAWQTENYSPDNPTYVVDAEIIESALGDGGATAMVKARLADEIADGIATGYRIRGCEGEIEWLYKLRKASRKGGEATKRSWEHKREPAGIANGHAAGKPSDRPSPSPLTPTLTLPPEKKNSLAPAHAIPPRTEQTPVPSPNGHEDPEHAARRRLESSEGRRPSWHERVVDRTYAFAREQQQVVAKAAGKPNTAAWPPQAGRSTRGDMEKCIDELASSGIVDEAEVDARMRHRVEIAAAEATRVGGPGLSFYTNVHLWDLKLKQFQRAMDTEVDVAAQPRAGPRGNGSPVNPNDQPRGIKLLP